VRIAKADGMAASPRRMPLKHLSRPLDPSPLHRAGIRSGVAGEAEPALGVLGGDDVEGRAELGLKRLQVAGRLGAQMGLEL
jgi:hypothetical protein